MLWGDEHQTRLGDPAQRGIIREQSGAQRVRVTVNGCRHLGSRGHTRRAAPKLGERRRDLLAQTSANLLAGLRGIPRPNHRIPLTLLLDAEVGLHLSMTEHRRRRYRNAIELA
jgi:hypothetical protein